VPKAKPTYTPEQLGLLTDEVKRGVGSGTLLRTLGPIYESRLESVLNALEQAPPNLEILLDLRAKLSTLRNLKRELDNAVRVGGEAAEQLT
jgi:hypothetical protein